MITSEPDVSGAGSGRRTLTTVAALAAPVCVAIFTPLFEYAGNASELSPVQLVVPLLLCAGVAALALLVFAGLLRDLVAGAAASVLVLALLFAYGPVLDLLSRVAGSSMKHRHFVPVFLVAMGYCVYLARRLDAEARAVVVLSLGVPAALLVCFNVVVLVGKELHEARPRSLKDGQQRSAAAGATGLRPDIWVLVLDEYASLSTIREQWGFDNEEFADFLRTRGFTVTTEARARYHETVFSLVSLLNMDYPGPPIAPQEFWALARAQAIDSRYRKLSELYAMLTSSRVVAYLRSAGYTIVTVNNFKNLHPEFPAWVPGDVEIALDEGRPGYLADEFSVLVAGQTLARPLVSSLALTTGSSDEKHRSMILYTLQKLRETSRLPGPKLVFAHILCPHTPFLFDEHGGRLPREVATNWRVRAAYLGQYRFITGQMQELVGEITDHDPDAVIMLLSDHGPRPFFAPRTEEMLKVDEEYPLQEMFKVFNAIRAPRVAPGTVDGAMAPVNNFRVVLNAYFGERYPRVADR